VTRVVTEQREKLNLRAVLYAVRVDGREIVTGAVGESMTGVPATPNMHFRNGSVAEAYMSTLLLRLVDEGVVTLDDRLSTWLPDFPHSDEVTLRQLAQMTSGYVGYEQLPELTEANYAAPFKAWTPEELLAYMADKPLWYPPGTNWNYAHTNYLLLGLAWRRSPVRTWRPRCASGCSTRSVWSTPPIPAARRSSPNRYCTRSALSAASSCRSRPPCPSMRKRPPGTRCGHSPAGRSRPATSRTC
jgi:hypothetical protein